MEAWVVVDGEADKVWLFDDYDEAVIKYNKRLKLYERFDDDAYVVINKVKW